MARSRAETRKSMVEAVRWLNAGPCARILDAGMGAGCLGEEIRAAFPNCELTGIDLWLRFMVDPICRKTEGWPSLSLYDSLVGGPEGELLRFLTRAPAGSYDVIVMGDVLEHMHVNHSLEILARARSVAARGVVVNVPVSDFPQAEVWNNEHEVHQWWQPREWWEAHGAQYIGGGNGVATFAWPRESVTSPELSVVVPAFNRKHYVDLCVRSLLRSEAPPFRFEIIVVDDGSVDGTDEFVRRAFAHRNVVCVRRTVNIGQPNCPGLARNVGLRVARGKWVAFLDCDVIHGRDVISATLSAVGKDAVYQSFGHWILETQAVGGQPEKGTEFRIGSQEESAIPMQMWWATRREVLVEIGGYDERFTVYGGEDQDVYTRLARRGLTIAKVPGMFAVGLYAPRKAGAQDVINIEKNEWQHRTWREDHSIVRNEGVEWGMQHSKREG